MYEYIRNLENTINVNIAIPISAYNEDQKDKNL